MTIFPVPPRQERETSNNSHTHQEATSAMDRAEITVIGLMNGMGEMDIRGAYVGFAVCVNNSAIQRFKTSVGQAQAVAQSLNGLLLDRHLGARTLQRNPGSDTPPAEAVAALQAEIENLRAELLIARATSTRTGEMLDKAMALLRKDIA